jgi:hypothetical protein
MYAYRLHHLMRHLIALALAAVLSACGSIPASNVATPASAETKAIHAAMQEHPARQSVPAATRIDVEIQIEQYARVRISLRIMLPTLMISRIATFVYIIVLETIVVAGLLQPGS